MFKTLIGWLIVASYFVFISTVFATCLPPTVKVLNQYGHYVEVNASLLQQNNFFRGYFVPDDTSGVKGAVRFEPSLTEISSLCSGGPILPSEDSEILPQIEPRLVPVPTSTYAAKVFDVDNDGLSDVYIQTNYFARVRDFYLQQVANKGFVLKLSNIDLQRQALLYPETEIVITRADYNADGMYDFLISSIDEYIAGADEQIILTKKGQTDKVEQIVAIDDKFRGIRDFIEVVNSNIDGATQLFVGLYDNHYSYCRVLYIPIYVWDEYLT